ncbi:MAG: hypothetical protein N3E51_02270 [Candidatus Micrarchaeota archaeon]|nr:hypothetical protein [Candidatus Micrarchaeota archaeon]
MAKRFLNHHQLSLFGQTGKQPEPAVFPSKEVLAEGTAKVLTYKAWSCKFRKRLEDDGSLPEKIKNSAQYSELVRQLEETVQFYRKRALENVSYLRHYGGADRIYRTLLSLDVRKRAIGAAAEELDKASGSLMKSVSVDGGDASEKQAAGYVRTQCTIINHACTMLVFLEERRFLEAMKLYNEKITNEKDRARSARFMKNDVKLDSAVRSFMAACLDDRMLGG